MQADPPSLRKKTTYPVVRDGKILATQADGTIVRLEGWNLAAHGGNVVAYDGVGGCFMIYSVPGEIRDFLDQYPTGLDTTGIHVRIMRPDVYDAYAYSRGMHEVFLYYYEPRPRNCTCGAQFTSFPALHSEWCDSYVYE